MEDRFKIGDIVSWRGGWGSNPARPATIESIHVSDEPHNKHASRAVQDWPWSAKAYATVSLTNGHWAYGDQLDPKAKHYAEASAQCVKCREVKPVCCDDGYRDLPGGRTEHDNPYCMDCCPNDHKPRFPAAGFGAYERMDG